MSDLKSKELQAITFLCSIAEAHSIIVEENPILDSDEFLSSLEPISIEDMIMDILDVPQDNVHTVPYNHPDFFCRDVLYENMRDIIERRDICVYNKARSIISIIKEHELSEE